MSGGSQQLAGETLAQISREIVSLKAKSYGKGATEAKSYSCDNFVFTVLKGGLTTVERTLVDHDDHELVRRVRLRYQSRLAESYRGVVERLTGRAVLTYESQVLFDPDYTAEIFVLAPPEASAVDL